jgi:oligoendopeptidase F
MSKDNVGSNQTRWPSGQAPDPFVGERDRSKIPDPCKWNLVDVYSSDETWQQERKKLVAELPSISRYRGLLGDSPRCLLECLDLVQRLQKEILRLTSYASLHADLDTREAKYVGMEQEMDQVGSDFAALAAFMEPEILRLTADDIQRLIAEEPGLGIYRHYLEDVLRKKSHTGTEAEEKILADAELIADSPNNIYGIFSNADFPFPKVRLEDGGEVLLDQAAFGLHRRSRVRADRKQVFETFFGRLNQYRRTFGTQLYAEVRKNLFFTRARRFGSCLERALHSSNIPVSVYENLIAGVRSHLDTFHRYLDLRRRILGVEELHYYDLYAPLVQEADLHYHYEEAVEHTLASLAPLGRDYVEAARRALTSRWVDVYPNAGKRAGAYMNGHVYDAHPYMLLNYNGKLGDVSTLTHELGHAMHSHLTNTTQPFPLAQYSIFVAEVASTFNEALLLHHLLETVSDSALRLSLLGDYLDGMRSTVFRQVQFAEFELKIHRTVEAGEALTGDSLSALYHSIAKDYYGEDRGHCIVDEPASVEWAYIPHFYFNFYVYQYATSFMASAAIAERMLGGDKSATEQYFQLLRAGGSNYPIPLLKKAGIDMTTREPLDAAIRKMDRVMDEVESLWGRTGPGQAGTR